MQLLNNPPFDVKYSQLCGQLADGTSVIIRLDQDGNIPVVVSRNASPSTLVGGTKTVSESDIPEPLVLESTPCQFVWLGARVDSDGVSINTKPAFIGDSTNQNIPIIASNCDGIVIQIDDASKIYVKVGLDGEGVVYRIFA